MNVIRIRLPVQVVESLGGRVRGNAADMVHIIGTSDALRNANSLPLNVGIPPILGVLHLGPFLKSDAARGFHFDVLRMDPLSADVINPSRLGERFLL